METSVPENGTLRAPRKIKLSVEPPSRIAGLAHSTRTAVADQLEPIRFEHSGTSNRSVYQDLGIAMERIQENMYRPQMIGLYDVLSRYLQGKNPHLNPARSPDIHQYFVECHAALGKFLRRRQNGEAPKIPLKTLFRKNNEPTFINKAAE